MADFPPAQYIDGYTATGDTISFTIAGYTGKKVASVTVTNGGSYTTPTASVAFSGGSGSGATATANMGLKTLSFASVGASSLLQTSQPESVQITTSDGLEITPLFGLATVSPNINMFFDSATTPTVSVSGENGTYSDASVSIDSSSSLHVASLSTPYTPNGDGDFEQGNAGSGSYPVSASVPVQIVNASDTNTVLGTATIHTNSAGRIDAQTIFPTSWNTAQSKSTLNGLSLKLKMTQPYYLVTGYEIYPTNRTVYFRTDGALQPSVFIGATSPYGSSASFTVNTNDVYPTTFKDMNTGNIYVPNADMLIKTTNGTHVANLGTGDSECAWIASPMTWTTANSNVTYNAFRESNPNGNPVAQLTIYTAQKNGSTAITYNGGGKYATDVGQASATNIYLNPDGTGDIGGVLDVYSEPTTEISTSAFAIKAYKMPISTASSRISATTAGSGYTEKLQVSSTGLYTEAELVNAVGTESYDQMLILNNSNVLSSGSTYTSSSSITITGGGLTNSNIVKNVIFKVNSVTITNGGTGYTTNPTVAISGSISSDGSNATATSALSATPAISLPNLTGTEADPTTGDFREICYSICELVNNIDTQSVRTSIETKLQTGGVGIIDKFTFVFDLVPEAGVLAVEQEP
jgi:hypothetical protein